MMIDECVTVTQDSFSPFGKGRKEISPMWAPTLSAFSAFYGPHFRLLLR